jgi:death-on-curing protein
VTPQVEYLDLDDLLYLARQLLGNPPPVRDIGLLGAAAARPQTTVLGEDAYPSIWEKATALLHSLVKNHPLVDGNKRLGWLATAVFLEINNVNVTDIPNDDVYRFVVRIAGGQHDVAELAADLERLAHTGSETER